MLRRRRNRNVSEILSEDGENSQKSQLSEFSDAEEELDLSYQDSSDDFTSDEGEANFQSCDESVGEVDENNEGKPEKAVKVHNEKQVLHEDEQSKTQCTSNNTEKSPETDSDKLTSSAVENFDKSQRLEQDKFVKKDNNKESKTQKSQNVHNQKEKVKTVSSADDIIPDKENKSVSKSEKLNKSRKQPISKQQNSKREKKGKRNREQYQNKKSNKEKETKQDVKVHHEEDLNDEEDHVEDLHVEEDEEFEENGAPITPRLGGFYQHDCSYKDPSKRSGRRRREFHSFEDREKEKWMHDKYSEHEQTPKTELELVDEYGYNIRKHSRGGRRNNFDGRKPNYQHQGRRNMRDYRDRSYHDNNRGYYDNSERHNNREHDLRQSHRDDVIRQLQQSATENQNVKVEETVEDDLNTTAHSTHSSNMTEENDGYFWEDPISDPVSTRFRKMNINQQSLQKDSHPRHKAEEIARKYNSKKISEVSERTVNIKDKQISITVPNIGRKKNFQPKRYSMLRQQNNLPKSNVNPVPNTQENQQKKLPSQDNSPPTNQQKAPLSVTNEHSEQQANGGQITSQSVSFHPEKQENAEVSAQTTSQNVAKKEDAQEKKQAFVIPQPQQQNFQQIVNQVYIPRHHSNQQLANHLREIIALKTPTNENPPVAPPLQWHPGNQLHSNQMSSSLLPGSHLPGSLHNNHLPNAHLPANQLQNQLHGQQLHSNAPAFNMPIVGATGEQLVGTQHLLGNQLLNNKMLPPQHYSFANQQAAAQQLMDNNFTNFPPPSFGQFLTSSGQQGREFGGLTYFDCPPPNVQHSNIQQQVTKLHHPKV